VSVVSVFAVLALTQRPFQAAAPQTTQTVLARAANGALVPVPVAAPFGIVFYRGAAWVVGSGKVVRIDPADDRPGAALGLAKGAAALFTQLAAGPSGLWATDYDRGMLYRLRVS